MSSLVSQSVVNAILSGNTRITRRAEIYESDGVTLFADAPYTKDGNVSVDYTRVDRRNFDLTLDNSEGLLVHDPDNGLWYDKIIKLYRGVKYTNTKIQPSVLVLGATTPSNIAKALGRVGLSNLKFVPVTTNLSISDVLGYDIVVGYSPDADFDVSTAALMNSAFQAGKNVLSVSNGATSTTIPLIATYATRTETTTWDVNPSQYDNLFSQAFVAFHTSRFAGETVPLAVPGGVRVVGTTTHSAALVPAVMVQQGASGGQWVHYHPRIDFTFTPSVNVALFLQLLKALISWLYSFGGEEFYETQLGEFCIDKISEPRRPHEIKISGRDHAKTLSLSKFDETVTFSAGTSVDMLVTAEAANAGIFKLRLAGNGLTLPGDMTFTRASDRMTALVAICASVNQEIFFDPFGYLVTRQFLDPALASISTYLTLAGDGANLISMEKSSDDSQLFNKIIVTGASASNSVQGLVFEGIAENNEPSSPTRIARIGERTTSFDMPTFTSDQQCLDYAISILKVAALEAYILNFSSLVFPWLEAGEITQYIDNTDTIAPTRYLMTNFNVPLGLAAQTGNAKRISIVG